MARNQVIPSMADAMKAVEELVDELTVCKPTSLLINVITM